MALVKTWRRFMRRYFSSEEAVAFVAVALLTAAMLYWFSLILAPFLIALAIAYLLHGVMKFLQMRLRCPRWLALSLVYCAFLTLLVLFFVVLLPLLWGQMTELALQTPAMLHKVQDWLLTLRVKYPQLGFSRSELHGLADEFNRQSRAIGQTLLSQSLAGLGVLLMVAAYLVLIPILVFFLLKDRDAILEYCSGFLPRKRDMLRQVWSEMDEQIANYLRGKAIEMLITGIATWIAFAWLGLQYAELLALLAGFSALIPYIGVLVAAVPVFLVALAQYGFGSDFGWALGVYTLIQVLDGNLLAPWLFSETVNLHPVAIVLAVLFFGGLWGFWGVFFAIPLATLLKATLNAWPKMRAHEEAD